MKYLLSSSLFFLLLNGYATKAQESTSSLLIGLDISKSIPALVKGYFFSPGLIVEPSVMIPLGRSGLYVNILTGYSSIRANPIYKNLDYHNQGGYLKAGLEYIIIPYLSFGASAVFSSYDEFGSYLLKGPYYGDIKFPFKSRHITAWGGEFHFGPRIPVGNRFYINPVMRGCLHSDVNRFNPDSYYIPGIGATSRDVAISIGMSVNVQYAIPIK